MPCVPTVAGWAPYYTTPLQAPTQTPAISSNVISCSKVCPTLPGLWFQKECVLGKTEHRPKFCVVPIGIWKKSVDKEEAWSSLVHPPHHPLSLFPIPGQVWSHGHMTGTLQSGCGDLWLISDLLLLFCVVIFICRFVFFVCFTCFLLY